jgi:hypothetical protein
MTQLWTWAGLQPAIAPPMPGRVHRLKDEPDPATKRRDARAHKEPSVCLLCGRITKSSFRLRVSAEQMSVRCCNDCQWHVVQKYSKDRLRAMLREAYAKANTNAATPHTIAYGRAPCVTRSL